jgi:hypothetical protein
MEWIIKNYRFLFKLFLNEYPSIIGIIIYNIVLKRGRIHKKVLSNFNVSREEEKVKKIKGPKNIIIITSVHNRALINLYESTRKQCRCKISVGRRSKRRYWPRKRCDRIIGSGNDLE